jgi:hypothetical protein
MCESNELKRKRLKPKKVEAIKMIKVNKTAKSAPITARFDPSINRVGPDLLER